MEVVVAEFVFHIEQNKGAASEAYCQACEIDTVIKFLFTEVSKSDF